MLWGAPAPAHLDAALAAPPAANLTSTVAQTSASIAGPLLWWWTRVAEQLGRLGQCAVLSSWLLTDFKFAFATSLCGEDPIDCGDDDELSSLGGMCPAALIIHVLVLLPPLAAVFGPGAFNRALPEAAAVLRSLAEPDADGILQVGEKLHRLDTVRVSLALAIGATAEPDLSTPVCYPPVRLRWAKRRDVTKASMTNAAEAIASERRAEPVQLAHTEAEGSVARLYTALGANGGGGLAGVSYEALHRALPRLGLFWTVDEWEAARDWLVRAQAQAGGSAVSPTAAAAATADATTEEEDQEGGADAAPGRCRRLLCCCRKRKDGGDPGVRNAGDLAGELLRQETLVRFLMTPPCELLTSEDPVSYFATASWKGRTEAETDTADALEETVSVPPMVDQHESHIVNPLLPILVHRQQAEATAAADAFLAAEQAEKAGLRLGFHRSIAAGGEAAGRDGAASGMRFRRGESHRTDAEVEAEVRAMWRRLDRDGSNSLSRPETAVLLGELMGKTPSSSELDVAFAMIDRDGSGDIDWREFWMWWQSQDPAAQAQLLLLNELSFDSLIPPGQQEGR